MNPDGSVSRWLKPLRDGDNAAVEELWKRYFPRLVGLARHKLAGGPKRVADEEDVALSAFDSFCRHAEGGRFPELCERDGLWKLLVVITARKAAYLKRTQSAQKRGGDVVVQGGHAGDENALLDEALGDEPTPEFAAEVADECRRLLGLLNDGSMEQIALWRMEGYSVDEIAAKIGCAPRSVGRKLQLIRRLWEGELDG